MTCKTIFDKCNDEEKHIIGLDQHVDGFELNEGNIFIFETNANVKAKLLVLQSNPEEELSSVR